MCSFTNLRGMCILCGKKDASMCETCFEFYCDNEEHQCLLPVYVAEICERCSNPIEHSYEIHHCSRKDCNKLICFHCSISCYCCRRMLCRYRSCSLFDTYHGVWRCDRSECPALPFIRQLFNPGAERPRHMRL